MAIACEGESRHKILVRHPSTSAEAYRFFLLSNIELWMLCFFVILDTGLRVLCLSLSHNFLVFQVLRYVIDGSSMETNHDSNLNQEMNQWLLRLGLSRKVSAMSKLFNRLSKPIELPVRYCQLDTDTSQLQNQRQCSKKLRRSSPETLPLTAQGNVSKSAQPDYVGCSSRGKYHNYILLTKELKPLSDLIEWTK